jgi:uncharacterized OsmC-like protein
MHEGQFVTKIAKEEGYRFRISFSSEKVPDLLMDEPAPLGKGENPNAGSLLAAAVGNCLCASLAFCLQKSRADIKSLCADVYTNVERNEQGRLRLTSMTVKLFPAVEEKQKLQRCREIFEDFCIVTQSVRQGIDVKVEVFPVAASGIQTQTSPD